MIESLRCVPGDGTARARHDITNLLVHYYYKDTTITGLDTCMAYDRSFENYISSQKIRGLGWCLVCYAVHLSPLDFDLC